MMKRSLVNATDDGEDESLWDVRPKKKQLLSNTDIGKTQKTKRAVGGKHLDGVTVKGEGRRKKTQPKDGTAKKTTPCQTPQKPVHDGHCPFCQMPFSLLILESPRCHASQCMDLPLRTDKECPDGANCTNTIASHFRTFLHTLLARLRSGSCTDKQDTTTGTYNIELEIDDSQSQTFYSGDLTRIKNADMKVENDSESQIDRCRSNTSTRTSTHKSLSVKGTRVSKIKSVLKSEKLALKMPSGDIVNFSEKTVVTAPKDPETPVDIAKRKLCFSESKRVESRSDEIIETVAAIDESIETVAAIGQAKEDAAVEQAKRILNFRGNSPLVINSGKHSGIPDLLEGTDCRNNKSTNSNNESYSDSDGNYHSPVISLPPTKQSQQTDRNKDVSDDTAASQNSEAGEVTRELVDENKHEFSDDEDDWVSCVSDLETKSETAENQTSAPSSTISTAFHALKHRIAPKLAGQPSIQAFFQPKGNVRNPAKNCIQNFDNIPPLIIPKPEVKKSWNNVSKVNNGRANFPQTRSDGGNTWKKTCPFYKKIPGTSITVDAFGYGTIPGCKAYFLSHFHYDHYGGLRKSFSHPLYCSKVTKNLVELKIKVAPEYLHVLPMDTPVMVEGVEVTLLEANHCPGAVLFLFRAGDGRVLLHTGDFRASLAMEEYPALMATPRIHTLYLDTTYCEPSHAFPPQDDVIRRGVELSVDFMHRHPNAVIIVGSYTIGKERIFLAIAEALQTKVCVTREKKGILDCLGNPTVDKLLTLDGNQAKVHVLKMGQLRFDELKAYLAKYKGRFNAVLAIEPTGWTHSKSTPSLDNIRPKMDREGITIYGLPYSEHSSYTEMKRFTQVMRPDNIIPTVNNGNPQARHKMEQLFQSWLAETPSSSPRMKQARLKGWLK